MTLIELAQKLRPLIEKAVEYLDDAEAIEATTLYPAWSGDGVSYEKDFRVKYNQVLYKVLQAHTSQPAWNPEAAPSLFAKVLIPDPEVIPEWEQPDSTNPYMTGDKVRYNGKIWQSTIDNNVWAPGTGNLWIEIIE